MRYQQKRPENGVSLISKTPNYVGRHAISKVQYWLLASAIRNAIMLFLKWCYFKLLFYIAILLFATYSTIAK